MRTIDIMYIRTIYAQIVFIFDFGSIFFDERIVYNIYSPLPTMMTS